MRRDRLQERLDVHPTPIVERIRGIAVRAAQWTAGQTHEHARAARVRRLALQRIEDLVDAQARGHAASGWSRATPWGGRAARRF